MRLATLHDFAVSAREICIPYPAMFQSPPYRTLVLFTSLVCHVIPIQPDHTVLYTLERVAVVFGGGVWCRLASISVPSYLDLSSQTKYASPLFHPIPLRPPNLPLPLIHLSLPPTLLRRPLNLLHQHIIIPRLALRLQHSRRHRILLAIPILQQCEQRVQVLCFFCWGGERSGRWRDDAFLGLGGLDLGRPVGEGDGLAGGAGGEGEEEGLVWAESVGGPEAEEAVVLGC